MNTLPANKHSLHLLRQQLAVYRRVLPSLDLKRRQLAGLLASAVSRRNALEAGVRADIEQVGRLFPGLADEVLPLEELFATPSLRVGRRSSLGVEFPVIEEVRLETRRNAPLSTPHWMDAYARALGASLERRLELEAASAECAALEAGLRRTLQRLNLFEKRLVPRARQEIHRIEVALDDAARAAVVRAKIAKRRSALRHGSPS